MQFMEALLVLISFHSAAGFLPTVPNLQIIQPTKMERKWLETVKHLMKAPVGSATTTRLFEFYASSSDEDDGSSSSLTSSSDKKLLSHCTFDVAAVIKYGGAILVQMGLFYTLFRLLDKLVATSGMQVSIGVNFVIFYAIALKSRALNPLANNRPKPKTLEANAAPQKRKMPSWTPPGVVFPIVWLLIIGPIRALTSAMVYQKVQCYANPAILALMLHLSIGDVWNTINNVEQRYGVAVVGVICVWLSKAFASWKYGTIVPIAGKLLSVSLVWLTIASALVTSTWRLNPDPQTGKPEPLYPVKGKATTKFVWFRGPN